MPEAALLAHDSMNGKLVGGRNLKVLPVSDLIFLLKLWFYFKKVFKFF